MSSTNEIFDDLRKMFNANPQSLSIVEEQIDLNIQAGYYKRSRMLRRQVYELSDIMEKVPYLYDPETRLEDKRDILVKLASFDDVEAFRAIEKFKNESEGEIRLWASMAYRESKAEIEGSLLDETQVIISTGLGGKGSKLRYFICFVNEQDCPFSDAQARILQGELECAIDKYDSDLESCSFSGRYMRAMVLIPITIAPSDVIQQVVDATEDLGGFLDETLVISNVKEMDDDEMQKILNGEMLENDVAGIGSFEFSDYDDENEDEEEDEEDSEDNDLF